MSNPNLSDNQFAGKTHVTCDNCNEQHEATPSHMGVRGEGQIYAVECPKDYLTDYYTSERLEKPKKRRGK